MINSNGRTCKASISREPSNPILDLADVKAVAILVHKVGVMVMGDNLFASRRFIKSNWRLEPMW